MTPRWVTAHLQSGNFPALVTQANPDGTLNLAVFTNTDTIYRQMVTQYVPETDDDEADKIGMWSE